MAAAPAAGPMAACLQPLAGLPPPDLSLPALEPVKNRDTYRIRPENELEEATWYSADEPDTLVEPTKTRLRSIHSKQATVISFANKSPYRVRALWIDFSGNEVVYSVLEPNTTRRYHTYQTHPWIVRELHTGTRMLLSGRSAVVGLAAEQTVEIAAPPQLKWSLDTFSCFPAPYKASVQGLLLAHKHLEAYAHQDVISGLPSIKSLKTPPCSPASALSEGPCSPRATLIHQGAVPTSPKAPRLTLTPVPASPSAAACCTPRAAVLAGSPAGSGKVAPGGAAATTSISISSEASHFKATLTVSSPTRAVLQQTVNIEVFNNPAGSLGSKTATTVNFGTQLPAGGSSSLGSMAMADQGVGVAQVAGTSSSSSRRSEPSSRKAPRAKHGLFNNLVHSFKHAFRPSLRRVPDSTDCPNSPAAPTTTHITLHLQQLLQGAVNEPETMEVDEAEASCSTCPWPPVGTHLGHLPSHLLVAIAELAAPTAWQTQDQCPKGRPDIQPILLACPPKSAEEVAAEEQQQQQQQQAEGGDAQQDDVPPLI